MTETPALKPCPVELRECPFCGGEGGLRDYSGLAFVAKCVTPYCGTGPIERCAPDAIAAWNKRSVGSEASGNSTGSMRPVSPLPSPPPVSEEGQGDDSSLTVAGPTAAPSVILDEITHPSEFIREEMDARDWGTPTMAKRMGGDYGINLLAIEMYLTIGPRNSGCRLGSMADDVARAFGVSAEFIQNMEAAWLAKLPPTDGAEPDTAKVREPSSSHKAVSEEVVEALKPFAALAKATHGHYEMADSDEVWKFGFLPPITAGDLRRASSAYQAALKGGGRDGG